MSFKDIKGQDEAVNYLRKLIEKAMFPSTLLFCGPQGTGKRLTALTFAKALNCVEKGLDSCDTCRNCKAIDNGVHPNVEVVGTGGFGIEDVRQVVENSRVPVEGGYKVNIFLDVDRLRIEAFNSMLKYFEEPPDSTINILVTSDVDLVPETVRSRSVEIRFKPVPANIMEKALVEKGVNREKAEEVSRISLGSFSKAFKMLDDELMDLRNSLLKDTLLFMKRDVSITRILSSFKSLYGEFSVQTVSDFFDDLLTVMSDLVFITVSKEPDKVANLGLMGFLVDRFFGFDRNKIDRISEILLEGKKRLLTNVSPLHIMMWSIFNIEEVAK